MRPKPPRSDAYWDDDVGGYVYLPSTMTVHEADRGPIDTGLLDQNGVPLYRVLERIKTGFQK